MTAAQPTLWDDNPPPAPTLNDPTPAAAPVDDPPPAPAAIVDLPGPLSPCHRIPMETLYRAHYRCPVCTAGYVQRGA